jgi:hypothetical protein
VVAHGADGVFHEVIDCSCPLQVVKPGTDMTVRRFQLLQFCLIGIALRQILFVAEDIEWQEEQ